VVCAELLERAGLLDAATAFVVRAQRGRGGVAVFEGPAGIGKSSLLAAVAAGAGGVDAAWARPTDLERTFGFGVARSVLDPLLAGMSPHDRRVLARAGTAGVLDAVATWPGDAGSAVAHGILHGLFRLLADLAATRPVLLVVDDAHWADDASMAWLCYLAPRLAELPVAVLLATRPVDAADTGPLARLLTLRGHVTVLPVPALSDGAVSDLLTRELGAALAASAVGRAADATGGNPFLLAELVLAWKAQGPSEDLPPSPQLRRAVGRAIGILGAEAVALAGAVAVLGGVEVALADAAELADLPPEQARHAADDLGRADVLEPGARLSFKQPLVREAVYGNLSPLWRAAQHARAARILERAGRAPEAIAAHLLLAPPAADPWAVEQLRRAARAALARGTPAAAIGLLRRAAAEPPTADRRAEVLQELGEAAALANAPEAEDDLRTALAAAAGGRGAAAIGLTLARVLLQGLRGAEACDILDAALAAAGDDPETAARIRAERFAALHVASGRHVPARPMPDPAPTGRAGSEPAERLRLASLALESVAAGADARSVAALAERALTGGRLLAEAGTDASLPYMLTAALWCVDRYDTALEHLDLALEHARRQGSPSAYAMARAGRAGALRRAGRLLEAEADALDALALAAEHALALVVPLALPSLLAVRVDRGQLDQAEQALHDHGFACDIPAAAIFSPVRHARGRLRRARGLEEEAAADFLAAGRALLRAGTPTPAAGPWRSDAALALAARGFADRAGQLAAEELALARRADAPRALGIALRAAALLGPATARAAGLEDAATRLRSAGSPVELARTLVDAGLAQLREGRREAGRASLREALDLADRHHADAVAARAQTELRVAGARPRRCRLSGIEALTPAELRIARLAGEGRTNREIAAALFLSPKTVESHLGRVYAKLDVRHRRELAALLATAATT